jgi:hypothetical protein
MQLSRLIPAFLLLAVALPAFGRHPSPGQLLAVTNNAVRYVVPNNKGLRAYVEAWEVQSGRKLWSKTIFRHYYIPPFGTECMYYEYLKSMVLQDDRLILTSDCGRTYSLDLRTRAVRRMKLKEPNHPAPGNAGITPRLTIQNHCSGMPEPERSAETWV